MVPFHRSRYLLWVFFHPTSSPLNAARVVRKPYGARQRVMSRPAPLFLLVYICSEDEPFCFRHYLNQKCTVHAQWASIWAMGCKVYLLIILLLSQFSQLLGHIRTYAFFILFYQFLFMFLRDCCVGFFYLFQVAYLCQFVL